MPALYAHSVQPLLLTTHLSLVLPRVNYHEKRPTLTCGVVGFGANDTHQLGSKNDVDFGSDLDLKGTIVNMACGDSYTLALTNLGRLLGWGNAAEGRLAKSTKDLPTADLSYYGEDGKLVQSFGFMQDLPHSIIFPAKVLLVATGAAHTLAHTDQNKLYVWGRAGPHLGLGSVENGEDIADPRFITSFDGVQLVDLACGATESAAVTGMKYKSKFQLTLQPKVSSICGARRLLY